MLVIPFIHIRNYCCCKVTGSSRFVVFVMVVVGVVFFLVSISFCYFVTIPILYFNGGGGDNL